MSTCPSTAVWLRMLLGNVTPPEHDSLESHLEDCFACPELLAKLSEGWCLAKHLLPAEGVAPGPMTLAMLLGMVNATPPDDDGRFNDDGPPIPPEIPGLIDWEYVGRGGMGVVFRAREVALDRPVAVKILPAGGRFTPSSRTRAVREALLMASLRHPNVVQVYRTGEFEGLPYLMMEWIDGGTLRSLIQSRVLGVTESAEVVQLLAKAVAEAHALGIIHRDLKPENVLLAADGGPGLALLPKLNDFGLARRVEDVGLTQAGVVLGTPGYMAPEQTGHHGVGAGEVGTATDIHGLGAILYTCLAGHAPYAGRSSLESLILTMRATPPPLKERRGDVPRDLATIVEKCLHASPSRRYRSAGELADELGRFLEGRPVLARPTSSLERWLKWARRHPALAASAALSVMALIASMAGVAYHVASIGRALSSATEARDKASQALGSLSGDVVQRLLERGSVLDNRDREFLVKVRKLFLGWPLEPDPATALKFRGDGLGRIGDVFEQVNQYDEARTSRLYAIEAYDESIRRGLATAEVIEARLHAMVLLHQTLTRMKRFVEAEVLARLLIQTRASFARKSIIHSRKLARDYIRLGEDLAGQGRDDEATVSFREAITRLESLKKGAPGDTDILEAEMRAYFLSAARSKHRASSEAYYRKLISLGKHALLISPNNAKFSRYLNDGLYELISVIQMDRPQEAMTILDERIKLTTGLVALHPEDNTLRSDLILAAAQAYEIRSRMGRPGDAESALKRAIEDAECILAAEPAIFDRARIVVIALVASADLFETTGRPRKAIEQWNRIVKILEPWRKMKERSSDVNHYLLQAHRRAAAISSMLGDHREAARRLVLAFGLISKLEENAWVRLLLARELLASGDCQGAKAAFLRAASDTFSVYIR